MREQPDASWPTRVATAASVEVIAEEDGGVRHGRARSVARDGAEQPAALVATRGGGEACTKVDRPARVL